MLWEISIIIIVHRFEPREISRDDRDREDFIAQTGEDIREEEAS